MLREKGPNVCLSSIFCSVPGLVALGALIEAPAICEKDSYFGEGILFGKAGNIASSHGPER